MAIRPVWRGSSTVSTNQWSSVRIVTSPPYYGLRDYGVDGQLGAEASPAECVENMRALFAEARRVLADAGTLWLNLGDSYASDPGARQWAEQIVPPAVADQLRSRA